MASSQEIAILAGGCFWGMQDLLRRYPSVISTRADIPATMFKMQPIAITAPMRKHWK
jgi:peptide methionine sulfoxide reductase MsrA